MTDQITPVSIGPGDARCPGPSTRDIILGDSTPTPAPLLAGVVPVRGRRPTSPTRSSPRPPTRRPSTITCGRARGSGRAARSTFPSRATTTSTTSATARRVVVRGPDGSIKAFHNACLHRGTQLKPPASMGYSPKLRCPFHGWTWSTRRRTDRPAVRVGLPARRRRRVPAAADPHRAVGRLRVRQLRRLPTRADGRLARGVPRRAARALRELGSRRSLRRGAHPQEAAGQLEGVGRGVPRGVPHPRNALSVDLHRRRRQRPVRRVRRQRQPLHPHDRHDEPARATGEAPRRAGDARTC